MTTSTSSQEILLQIRNLNKNFGGLQAIDDVTMDLPAGVITTLVGPNGAGKTTLFNLITGHLIPSSGTVHWLGKPLKGVEPWRVARLGIARTFQDLRLYNQMTVEENIMTVMERGSWLWQAGRKAAEQGYAPAQFFVGRILIESVEQERKNEGIEFLRRAIAGGSSVAAFFLAAVEARGDFGVTKDESAAEAILKPFAERGDAECQFALASLYKFGASFADRREESNVWLKRASDQGHQQALEVLRKEE
jgi:ABC-type Fe3+/spermidine/putrescine transport system ATPase subunit